MVRKNFVSASTLTKQEVKKILLTKIKEEQSKIFDDNNNDILKKVTEKNNKANVDSLFSGAGGLDLGLELAGIDDVKGT